MADSIIQNGFGDAPAPMEPFKLNDPVNSVPSFTIGVASKIAKGVQANNLGQDVKLAAFQGVDPYEYFDNLGKKAQEVTQVNQNLDADINKVKSDIATLKPGQADQSNYQAALGAFQNLANNAPVAPMLQQMNLTDTDKLMMGFALLSGVPANDAIGNFIKVKQGFTDQANQIAQRNYTNDYNVWNQRLDAAGQMVTNERQAMNDVQQSMDRQYNDQLDSLGQQYTQLMQTGRTQDATNVKEHYQASQMLNAKWKQKGVYTQADYDADVQKAIDAKLDPNQIIFPPIDAPTTQKQGQDFSQGQATAKVEALKATQTWKNAKELFDMRLKQVNMIGKVTEADRKALLPLAQKLFPESPESLLPQIGEDWKMLQGQQRITETNRANTARETTANKRVAISQQQANTSAARESRLLNGGGEVKRSAKAKNDEVNPWLLHDIGQQGLTPTIGTANSGHSDMTKSGNPSRHKKGNAVDITHINGYAVTTPEGKKLAEQYVANLVKAGYTRNKENGNDMSVLWDMNGHYDHIHVGRKSRPASTSKDNPGYGVQTEGVTQNPPAQTKPAKSSQNANKGQSPPKQLNFDGQTGKLIK